MVQSMVSEWMGREHGKIGLLVGFGKYYASRKCQSAYRTY
ncbi:hypothetical protein THF1D04_220018 [Vibrio owensii]|uniref:Uncharacterized protein n=1 Tax=Vibrio owensii TaxID=696485 RepID=A0AAU9Q5X2_9VIBR|nr:hypothetical protein THF1D04_220018 [Vibrio owensii]